MKAIAARTGHHLYGSAALLALLSMMLLLSGSPGAQGADREGSVKTRLYVLKRGDSLFIRSGFSPQEDLVVRVGKGSNGQINFTGASLVSVSAGMSEKDLGGGRVIHANGDDSTPWNINGTYIGANHGCAAVRELTCPGDRKSTRLNSSHHG